MSTQLQFFETTKYSSIWNFVVSKFWLIIMILMIYLKSIDSIFIHLNIMFAKKDLLFIHKMLCKKTTGLFSKLNIFSDISHRVKQMNFYNM